MRVVNSLIDAAGWVGYGSGMTTVSEVSVDSMQAARRRSIVKRHVEHIRNATTDFHPDGARILPAREHLDPEVVAAERELLHTVPLVAAHSSQLPGPGSYRAEELLDVPIMLVRQKDGTVRAFLNSCSHRSARLVEGDGTVDHRIRCPYHAWSYSLGGDLVSITQQAKFGEIDRSCLSLVSLPCAERYGLIFVILDPSKTMDIDEFLGDFAPQLRMAELDTFAVSRVRHLPHEVNWKLALCGYLESYHVTVVHAKTLASSFIGNISTHDAFGPDGRHFLTTWPMTHVADMAKAPDVDAAIDALPHTPANMVLYLWPNTIITVPDFIGISHLLRITPGVRPGEQLTDFRILLPKESTPEEVALIEAFDDLTVLALEEEDYGQVIGIQKALNSGLRTRTVIGANEPSLTEMHRNLARAVGRTQPDLPAT